MANGDPVLTAAGNIFLDPSGNPVLEGKAISSVTCNLSLTAGLAFVTTPSINLSVLAGKSYKLTLNDGTQDLIGWIKDAGSAETSTENIIDGGVDFVASANDTLTLLCDGSEWYEVSRSINS